MNSKLILIVRIILGLILLVFGINKFFGFLPDLPLDPNGGAYKFFGALIATGYMIPLIGIVEILAGALLILKKAVPFALVILAPISVNIILFHAVLDPANIPAAALVAILNSFLISQYWSVYKALFK